MNLLVVDNFDSFTYMLVDYLRQAGANCRIVRNNVPLRSLIEIPVDGVVLSPGPGTPKQAGGLMDFIAHYYQHIPMLGICLGHQALGEFFGATLLKAERPMHGKLSTIEIMADDILWNKMPRRFNVTRYHSLVLSDMPPLLQPLAITEQKEIMAMRHKTLPLWGIQFHPEAALSEYGYLIIKNWVKFVLEKSFKANLATPLTKQ